MPSPAPAPVPAPAPPPALAIAPDLSALSIMPDAPAEALDGLDPIPKTDFGCFGEPVFTEAVEATGAETDTAA